MDENDPEDVNPSGRLVSTSGFESFLARLTRLRRSGGDAQLAGHSEYVFSILGQMTYVIEADEPSSPRSEASQTDLDGEELNKSEQRMIESMQAYLDRHPDIRDALRGKPRETLEAWLGEYADSKDPEKDQVWLLDCLVDPEQEQEPPCKDEEGEDWKQEAWSDWDWTDSNPCGWAEAKGGWASTSDGWNQNDAWTAGWDSNDGGWTKDDWSNESSTNGWSEGDWANQGWTNAWADQGSTKSWTDQGSTKSWTDQGSSNAWAKQGSSNAWAKQGSSNSWVDQGSANAWAKQGSTNIWLDEPCKDDWDGWTEASTYDGWTQDGSISQWSQVDSDTWEEQSQTVWPKQAASYQVP
ncbi:unnamed protein product [Symbiodinium sp. CCMP2592]|nr:unnamed protein product [Symbiodinium sp. CCMP2592]